MGNLCSSPQQLQWKRNHKLREACRHGDEAAVERHLKAGADPNARSRTNATPIGWCIICYRGSSSLRCIFRLIEAGAAVRGPDARYDGRTLMLNAERMPEPIAREQLIALLTQRGAE